MDYECTREDVERGKRIRMFRTEMGLTQTELAERLQISVNTLSGWENGRRMSVKHRYQFCQELHISPDLLGDGLSDLAGARKFQLTFLRQLKLCKDCEQKVEVAINQYYGETNLLLRPV